jgi:hypothetical protein
MNVTSLIDVLLVLMIVFMVLPQPTGRESGDSPAKHQAIDQTAQRPNRDSARCRGKRQATLAQDQPGRGGGRDL